MRTLIFKISWLPQRIVIGLVLAAAMAGCYAKKVAHPQPPHQAYNLEIPRITIKDQTVVINEHSLSLMHTPASVARYILGPLLQPGGLENDNSVLQRYGYVFYSGKNFTHNTSPEVVDTLELWLRQEDSTSESLECNAEWLQKHQASQKYSIDSIRAIEKEYNLSKLEVERKIDKVLSQKCTMPAKFPKSPFKGYVEVDGIPLTGNMTLGEIQACRKKMGLKPLRVDPNSGSPYYRSSKAGNDTSWEQNWYFEIPPGDNVKEADLLLTRIRLP